MLFEDYRQCWRLGRWTVSSAFLGAFEKHSEETEIQEY